MRRLAGENGPEHLASRRTLLVAAASDTVSILAQQLGGAGYVVMYPHDLLAALARLPRRSHIAVLLEMGSRHRAALETCRAIRRVRNLPVIVVTGLDAEEERIAALEAGADDALSPPFCPAELVARLSAVTRRYHIPAHARQTTLRVGDLAIDLDRCAVTVAGNPVFMREREFALLAALARQPGVIWPRGRLHAAVWGMGSDVSVRAMDTHVRALRAALLHADVRIRTVWGIGYTLT